MFDEQLIILGTGIRIVGQLTVESMAYLQRADRILSVVEDSLASDIFASLNPKAEHQSLVSLYQEGEPRRTTYEAMVQAVMNSVRKQGLTVCAFYGHPGVMAYPGHEAIRRARLEGFQARMLPAVSAEDCLFADLGIDPATHGCQSYEASDILRLERSLDPTSHLILWQAGVVGDANFHRQHYNLSAFPRFVEKLLQYYPPTHEVTIYEAALTIGCEAHIRRVKLDCLHAEDLSPRSTLSLMPVMGTLYI
jgi:uncharacterized protein YabN with tetrapyrrole methylase and pyrophosphatase domain